MRPPVPVYSKLLLENKIFLFFALFLLLLGLVTFFAQYHVARRMLRGSLTDRFESVVAPLLGPMGEAVAKGDRERLARLSRQALALHAEAAYVAVLDVEGAPLAHAAALPALLPRLEAALAKGATPERYVSGNLALRQPSGPVGTLQAGFDRQLTEPYADRLVWSVALATLMPVVLLFVAARVVIRKAVEPLKKLTRVADEISTGNLDPKLDFGVRVNCWEIKNCGRTDCKAYMNFSRQCWFIDGTPCEGYEPSFPQKLQGCRTCEVYQAHRGDEIVQLADSFRHMTNVLKESREQLITSDDFQKRLIRNSFDGIIAADSKDVITIFNRVAESLTGVFRDDVVGSADWRSFFEPGLELSMDQPLSHERTRRIRGFRPRESVLKRGDGAWIDVRLAGISLYERGLNVGKVLFFQDMREIKGLREELIRSERLAATGQAAAGISHSIKNILDGLQGGVYVFKQGERKGDVSKKETGWDMIERNVEIISNLVKDLLNFAKERRPDYEAVDPTALFEDVCSSLGLNGKGRVRVLREVQDPSARIKLDSHAFHQCLSNLLRNAVEAIPEDRPGTVALRFRVEGERALISVSDNGVGMSPGTIEKVRGGMYSTKGSKGTGLGLLVIQKIVSEHAGTLSIQSQEGKGSTFQIDMPLEGGSAASV